MKILGIVALVLSVVGLASGIYCEIEYMPKVDQAEIFGPQLYDYYMESKLFYGYIALFSGVGGFLVGLITAAKKQKLGLIALGLGIISIYFGLAQSTHMFS